MARQPARAAHSPGRRRQVLKVLTDATAPLTIAAIASQLRVHPNTVRFHLDALAASGQAEIVAPARRRPGRPAQLFRAVRRMDPAGPRHYELLAGILVQSVAAEPEPGLRAAEAGRAWGRQLALPAPAGTDASAAPPGEAVARLVELLGDLGFDPDPQLSAGRPEIGLRHCPFLELAQTRAQVVCPVHLGLMQGAMAAWEAPVTVTRLDPFAEPDLCIAHLARTGADG